uniref:Uncharacterized protein n=1 Tax=Arundo donax TaxID=35708 RepID=A0A0A9GLK4_ARUDO
MVQNGDFLLHFCRRYIVLSDFSFAALQHILVNVPVVGFWCSYLGIQRWGSNYCICFRR